MSRFDLTKVDRATGCGSAMSGEVGFVNQWSYLGVRGCVRGSVLVATCDELFRVNKCIEIWLGTTEGTVPRESSTEASRDACSKIDFEAQLGQ
jgi:hypothetical protein